MKFAYLLVALCGAFLLTSCGDNSLLTDEEYKQTKGPAPFSPDPANLMPEYQTQNPYVSH